MKLKTIDSLPRLCANIGDVCHHNISGLDPKIAYQINYVARWPCNLKIRMLLNSIHILFPFNWWKTFIHDNMSRD